MRRRRARAALAESTGRRSSARRLGEVNTGACDDLDGDRRRCRGARARGSTSTARSGSGPRRARRCGISPPARARRLVGDRRAQVAQRPVRRGHRVLRPSRRRTAPRSASAPRTSSTRPTRPRTARLDARALAPRARLPGLRGAALARPHGRRRARRALLRPRARLAAALAELRAARSSTRSCSTRCSSASRTTRRPTRSLAAVQASGEAWMSGTAGTAGGDPALGLVLADDRATSSAPSPRSRRPRRLRRGRALFRIS